MRCTVCDHPERDAIARALVGGASLGDVAARFGGLSKSAVGRHAAQHLPATLAQSARAAEVARADTILERLAEITKVTRAILADAYRSRTHALALQAVARLERQLELEARLLGELRDGPTVNVVLTPEWARAIGVLLAALAPYPEARVRAADALAQLEGGAARAN